MEECLKKYPIKGEYVKNIFVGDEDRLMEYKDKAGVYFIKDKVGKIMYIGETGDLGGRVIEHIDGDPGSYTFDHRKNIHSINLFVIDENENKERRKPLEMDLIMVINPPLNYKDTPEYGSKQKMLKKIEEYKSKMPKVCEFEQWSPYEKCAFQLRKPLEYVILKASAEIEWDMNGEQLNWREWDRLQEKYLKELSLTRKDIEDIIWNKIILEKSLPKLNDLLVKKKNYENSVYNSITSEFLSQKYERPNRGKKEAPDVDSIKKFYELQEIIPLTQRGIALFQKLKNRFQGNLSSYHKIEIFHEKSIVDLRETEVWRYLMRVARERIIDEPISNYEGRLGEYVLALLTHDEWTEANNIKEREGEINITLSEYEE
jgi:hypothetical protein